MAEFVIFDNENPDAIFKRKALKNTADKVRMILSKVQNNPSDSAKRWVWELMQNAKDVPNKFERVSIKIVLSPDKLEFMHNGNPFDLDNIYSLILQNSSKDSLNSDEDVTGKFGTGFISTHLLSEIIEIKGVIFNKGLHRKFNTLLDRSGRSSEEMIPKIDKALEYIRDIDNDTKFPIVNNYEVNREQNSFDTVFKYNLTSEQKQKAAFSGIDDLVNTLPVTLVNLPKIRLVEVVNNDKGIKETYHSELVLEDGNIRKLKVSISSSFGERSIRNFITYSNSDVSLAVEVDNLERPVLKELPTETPRLFRDFPLIGSNKFYFPYILNGFKFTPTEDRDGVSIHGFESYDHQVNRKIIDEAFSAAVKFTEWLVEHNVSNMYVCAFSRLPDEKWEDFSKQWYNDLQEKYREFLLSSELVETDEGCIALKDAIIPAYGQSKESKMAFYDIVKPFAGASKVPNRKIIRKWIKTIGPSDEIESWNHDIKYDLEAFLTELSEVENIERLEKRLPKDLNAFEWLNSLYEFLSEERETECFEEYKIIPNHLGDFYTLDELYLEDENDPIENQFLDILDKLERNWREELIDRRISIPLQNIQCRDLGDASKEINEEIRSLSKDEDFADSDLLYIAMSIIRLEGLQSTGESFKVKLFKMTTEMFDLDIKIQVIKNIKSFDFEVATEIVSDVVNREVENLENLEALADHLEKDFDPTVIWYNRYLELLENSETYKGQLEYCNIIPNRYGKFCAMEDIYAFGTEENPLDEKLVDLLYDLNNKKDWKQKLLHDGFSLDLEPIKFEELGTAIDEALVERMKEESYDPGSILEFKSAILDLINWVRVNKDKAEKYLNKTCLASDNLWVKFSMTDEIMEVLTDEKSLELLKEISKSHISLSDVNELIHIADALDDLGVDGISSMLRHARDLLEVKEDFNFKKEIGEKVEKIFKQTLLNNGIDAEFMWLKHDGIGSHDFEITNAKNQKKFYIELKSYGKSSGRTLHLAPSQAKFGSLHPDNYCLASIERPVNIDAVTEEYIKSKLVARTNIETLVSKGLEDYDSYNQIDKEKNLHLILREDIRIKVNHVELKETAISFYQLVEKIKTQLT